MDARFHAEINDTFCGALAEPVPVAAKNPRSPRGRVLIVRLFGLVVILASRRVRSEVQDEGAADPSALPRRQKVAEACALRVTAENLNRLLGLAGESVVASRRCWWMRLPSELLRFKRLQNELTKSVERRLRVARPN